MPKKRKRDGERPRSEGVPNLVPHVPDPVPPHPVGVTVRPRVEEVPGRSPRRHRTQVAEDAGNLAREVVRQSVAQAPLGDRGRAEALVENVGVQDLVSDVVRSWLRPGEPDTEKRVHLRTPAGGLSGAAAELTQVLDPDVRRGRAVEARYSRQSPGEFAGPLPRITEVFSADQTQPRLNEAALNVLAPPPVRATPLTHHLAPNPGHPSLAVTTTPIANPTPLEPVRVLAPAGPEGPKFHNPPNTGFLPGGPQTPQSPGMRGAIVGNTRPVPDLGGFLQPGANREALLNMLRALATSGSTL